MDERDWLQREIFVTGAYEPEVWAALSSFLTADEVMWDVGAHVGSFAIRALVDPRVREVHAFEPDPVHADVLAINLALNKGQYTIHRFALSGRRERARLYHGPPANTGLSSLAAQPNLNGESFEVDCRTADELVFEGLAPPTLMKIDVEGWESEVLYGAVRLLSESPPKAIVFEAEYMEGDEIRDRSLARWLESLGWNIRHIKRPSGLVEERENFIAVHQTYANLYTSVRTL